MKEQCFMKTKAIHCLYFFAMLALLGGVTACTKEEMKTQGEGNHGNITLNYRIASSVEGQTYSVIASARECQVDEVYTLFFRASDHTDANKYVGYTRTAVSASSSSGTAQISMPGGESSGDAWQLIFLANFDRNTLLEGEPDVRHLLTDKLKDMTFDEAKKYLTAYFDDVSGLTAPFPMSFSMKKEKTADIVDVIFKRRMARIDVNVTTSDFVMESAQVWNARTKGYFFDEAGNYAGGNSEENFENYRDEIVSVSAEGKVIQAQLYAFPNSVAIPGIRDHETTCLIIGGKYSGSEKTTYYRVNVCVPGGSQNLKANSAYTLKITKATGAGEDDPETAYDQSQLKLEYTFEEWDDSFPGGYIFDKDGNGLAVAQRNVTFSSKGEQKVQLEVFTIKSSTRPISSGWSVGSLIGTDAVSFSAEKGTTASAKECIQISTLADNVAIIDRRAEVMINWGGISVLVNLTQMSPASTLSGIKVSVDDPWIPRTGGMKEVCVSLQGNFVGITRADIAADVFYDGTESGWLTLSQGTTPDNPARGLYYYNLSALVGAGVRSGGARFAVTQGSSMAIAQERVTQINEEGTGTPQLTMSLYEKSGTSYTNRGNLAEQYGILQGIPEGHSGANHLHFAMFSHDYLKYRLTIQTSMPWRIVAPGLAGTGLSFSKTSDPGDPNNPKIVEITASQDVSKSWNGSFYVEYRNGDRTVYAVHQEGIFATLPTDNRIYYYNTMTMNGRLWLDRNLGATVGQDKLLGYYSNYSSTTGVDKDARGRGAYLTRAQANTACPPGFRLPKRTTGSGEWDWVSANVKTTGSKGSELYGATCVYVLYVVVSSNPAVYWLFPVCGYSTYQSDTSAYYWSQEVGYFMVYSSTGNGSFFTKDPTTTTIAYSVRCIRE